MSSPAAGKETEQVYRLSVRSCSFAQRISARLSKTQLTMAFSLLRNKTEFPASSGSVPV